MEGCIGALQAEAEAREEQLARQSARAAAAEQECATLKESLAASEAELAAYAASNAQQVSCLPNGVDACIVHHAAHALGFAVLTCLNAAKAISCAMR